MEPDVRTEIVEGAERPLLRKWARSPAGREQLAQEADRLHRSRHLGVVTLVAIEDDHLDLEWAGAETLALARLTRGAAAQIVADLAQTVAGLHDLGIVHGRLDESHVVIGADRRPRLCGLRGPQPGAVAPGPADDVGDLGSLLRRAMGMGADPDLVPERRWRARPRTSERDRALESIAARATDPDPARRPTARALARALAEVVPEIEATLRTAGSAAPAPSTAPAAPGAGPGAVEHLAVTPDAGLPTVGTRPPPPVPIAEPARSGPPAEPAAAAAPARVTGARLTRGKAATTPTPTTTSAPASLSLDPEPDARPGPAAAVGSPVRLVGEEPPNPPSRPLPDERPDTARAEPRTRWLPRVAAWAGLAGAVVAVLILRQPASGPAPGPSVAAGGRASIAMAPTTELVDGAAPAIAVVAVPGTSVTHDGVDYEVGIAGDHLFTGDWDCDGVATAGLVRPATGEVFLFGSWPTHGQQTIEAVATLPGARGLASAGFGTGCEPPTVILTDGTQARLDQGAG